MSADPDPTQTAAPPGDVDPDPVPEDVQELAPAPGGGRIVVGVDDSEQAATALRWALAEAVLRGSSVEVVHAWSPPLSALPFGATLVVPVDEGAIDAAARTQLDDMVADALAQIGAPSDPGESGDAGRARPDIQITVLPGSPATTLVEVAEDADLLVVGSHGRTGLGRLVLGSVAMACVQHAHCPVVVVRTPPVG
jgi:nucleotide-binding universal stress UspA family protein